MKKIFSSKFNIFLIIMLLASISALGYFSYKLIFQEPDIIVEDFSNKNIDEVIKWCNNLGDVNPCIIEREYSDKIDKDKVIYQSISAGEVLDNKISFVISLGQKVEISLLNIDKNTTKENVEEWVKLNSLTNVTYIEEESSEVEKGCVITIQPEKIINSDTEVKVYISSGIKKQEENIDIIVNSGKYIDINEEEFISEVKKIGLTPKHADKKDEYSSTIEKGKIVWHGSGTYYSSEEIRYGLSLGKTEEIIVNSGDFKGITFEEFKKKVEALGLVPTHNKNKEDDYSSTIKENCILWHGSGTYTKGEEITYTLSKGSTDSEIVIKSGDYLGISFEEFKKKVEELGLVPKHNSNINDDYSSEIDENCILWHGSGTYTKGEEITYALSKGLSDTGYIHINAKQYVGKTFEEFKKAVEKLGLVVEHSEKYDDEYNETIPAGSLDWHGSGDYTKGEAIHYTLSLGKEVNEIKKVTVGNFANLAESEIKKFISNNSLSANRKEAYSDSVTSGYIISNFVGTLNSNEKLEYTVSIGKDERINVSSFEGKTETELLSFLSNNSLNASKNEQYSSTYDEGIIISNDTGLKNPQTTIEYIVSKGVKKANIMAKTYYSPYKKSTFDETKNNLSNNAFSSFTNVTYTGVKSEYTPGVIVDILVNSNSDYSPGDYPLDTKIEVKISTGN